MKKAFSLFELIIVLVIISIIVSFIAINSKDSITLTKQTNIKAELALIKSAISREVSKTILLDSGKGLVLDKALINKKGEALFENVLNMALISTSDYEKEIGKFSKLSKNKYRVYISEEEHLDFEFKTNTFVCISSKQLCKEYE